MQVKRRPPVINENMRSTKLLLQIRLQISRYLPLHRVAPLRLVFLTYSFLFISALDPAVYLSQREATIAFHIFSLDIAGISFHITRAFRQRTERICCLPRTLHDKSYSYRESRFFYQIAQRRLSIIVRLIRFCRHFYRNVCRWTLRERFHFLKTLFRASQFSPLFNNALTAILAI